MSRATGLVLVAAGLGVAVYAIPQGREINYFQSAEPVQSATVVTVADSQPVATAQPPLAAPAPKPAVRPQKKAPRLAQSDDPRPSAAPLAPVATAPVKVKEAATRRPILPPQKAAQVPGDRASLARELQKELRRTGCYEGEINGAWTTSTRKAMKAFTDRANATLPLDDPDYILLSLVQSNPDNFCGKACPSGQGLASDGRCLPDAILAQAAKKAAVAAAQPHKTDPTSDKPAAIVGWSTTTTTAGATPATPPPEGRMALAGPNAEAPADRTSPPDTHPARPVARAPWPSAAVFDRNRSSPPRYGQRGRRDVRSFFGALEASGR